LFLYAVGGDRVDARVEVESGQFGVFGLDVDRGWEMVRVEGNFPGTVVVQVGESDFVLGS